MITLEEMLFLYEHYGFTVEVNSGKVIRILAPCEDNE